MTLREWVNEALATALLLATVVGSGIMAERLAGGNDAVALLGNTIATAAMLPVLIWTFRGPAMNPAVTLVLRGPWLAITAQVAGAIVGVWLAHAMFEAPVWQLGVKPRAGLGQWLAELIATFALLTVVLRTPAALVAPAVGLVVAAGYWFTASTSFANPAVTLARGLTDSFAGITPADVPAFILAQLAGAYAAKAFWTWQDGAARAG